MKGSLRVAKELTRSRSKGDQFRKKTACFFVLGTKNVFGTMLVSYDETFV